MALNPLLSAANADKKIKMPNKTMNDNTETCPVCDETYNHRIENGYRNGWPTEGGDVATIKFEVCTTSDSDTMYVHTKNVSQIMNGDGLADILEQSH